MQANNHPINKQPQLKKISEPIISGSLYACKNSSSLKDCLSSVQATTHLPSNSIRGLDPKQILDINHEQKDVRLNSIKNDQRQANYTVFYYQNLS